MNPEPRWASATQRFTNYLVHDCLGGPRPWKLSWVINFQKAGTFVFLLALIASFAVSMLANKSWIAPLKPNVSTILTHYCPVQSRVGFLGAYP